MAEPGGSLVEGMGWERNSEELIETHSMQKSEIIIRVINYEAVELVDH